MEVWRAGPTARHLIFRLHSIKLGDSRQLMSTMTFSRISATVAFNHSWLGDRTLSPARLEVELYYTTGCSSCSFYWSPLQQITDMLHFWSSRLSHTLFFSGFSLPCSSSFSTFIYCACQATINVCLWWTYITVKGLILISEPFTFYCCVL